MGEMNTTFKAMARAKANQDIKPVEEIAVVKDSTVPKGYMAPQTDELEDEETPEVSTEVVSTKKKIKKIVK